MATVFQMMTGHVVVQSRWYRERGRAVPWARVVATAIHARRSRFVNQADYIQLARELEAAARAQITADRRPPRRVDRRALAQLEAERIRGLGTEARILRAAEAPPPIWQATARRAILASAAPTSNRTRALGLRKPRPEPPAIALTILTPREHRLLTPDSLTPGQRQSIAANLDRLARASRPTGPVDLSELAALNDRRL